MVNWHDPTVLNQYYPLIKLDHAIAGIYIWELVLTARFELDILRGKRPYRWTIWLYLGTRYSALLMLIIFLIRANGVASARLSCQLLIANNILVYASWAFASLLITLRVIAIWNRNIYMSSLLLGTWLADLALYIYLMAKMRTSYDPTIETCTTSDTRSFMAGAVGSLVVDVILVISMLIGLVRSPHSSTTGLWRFLYQQSFIWLVLATLADVPLMVLLILNLNEPINKMFTGAAVVVVSIGAARIYRSLFQYTSSTELASFSLPQGPPKIPYPQQSAANVRSSIHFASGTQSNGTVTTPGAVIVSVQTEHVRLEFPPEIVHDNTEDKDGCELA